MFTVASNAAYLTEHNTEDRTNGVSLNLLVAYLGTIHRGKTLKEAMGNILSVLNARSLLAWASKVLEKKF